MRSTDSRIFGPPKMGFRPHQDLTDLTFRVQTLHKSSYVENTGFQDTRRLLGRLRKRLTECSRRRIIGPGPDGEVLCCRVLWGDWVVTGNGEIGKRFERRRLVFLICEGMTRGASEVCDPGSVSINQKMFGFY